MSNPKERPMSRWWRAHASALDDPKVQRLPGETFKAWFNVLCIACLHEGTLPPVADIAFALRKSKEATIKILDALHAVGLLDVTDKGMSPHNWNGRQYKSDVSTARVKEFRERQRNVSVTPSESESESETDTEAETEKTEAIASERAPEEARHAKRSAAAHRLPEDWWPSPDLQRYASDRGLDPESTAAAFRDWWHAENGPKAIKRDWDAAFRTWCRRQAERPAPRGGPGVRPALDGGDVGAFARAAVILGRNQPVRE